MSKALFHIWLQLGLDVQTLNRHFTLYGMKWGCVYRGITGPFSLYKLGLGGLSQETVRFEKSWPIRTALQASSPHLSTVRRHTNQGLYSATVA